MDKNNKVNSDIDKNIMVNAQYINFNDDRIIKYNTFKNIINTCTNLNSLPDNYSIECKQETLLYNNISSWMTLSFKNIRKESINFPIIYNIRQNKDSMMIYFEKIKFKLIDSKIQLMNIPMDDAVSFQKILIGYTLFNLGLMSSNYYFDIYEVPSLSITFKIKDMFFSFIIKKLVILSTKTNLIRINILQNEHLKIILTNSSIDYQNDNMSYIKFFITYFLKYLDTKMMPTIPNQLNFENPILDPNPQRGTFVKIMNNNLYIYGILTDYLDNILEIWHISENKYKKDFVEIFNKSINEVYKKEKFIFITKNYVIGESNFC
jgi:hypothetical protein